MLKGCKGKRKRDESRGNRPIIEIHFQALWSTLTRDLPLSNNNRRLPKKKVVFQTLGMPTNPCLRSYWRGAQEASCGIAVSGTTRVNPEDALSTCQNLIEIAAKTTRHARMQEILVPYYLMSMWLLTFRLLYVGLSSNWNPPPKKKWLPVKKTQKGHHEKGHTHI